MNNQAAVLTELPRILWKRRIWIAVSILAGLACAVAGLKWIPARYVASTMIMVESQKIPTNYIRPIVTSGMAERLRTLEQQIVNRENLERIARDMDLYPDLRQRGPMEKVVEKVRRDLTLEVTGNSVFRIIFRGADPQQVADTANWIAGLFIEENLRLRNQQARGTTAFLSQELEHTKTALERQERKVADFRVKHEGELPEQRESISQALGNLQSRLQITLDLIDKAELRGLLLRRKPERREVTSVVSGDSDTVSTSARVRLREAQLEKMELLSRFTDEHPDVIRIRREILQLERQAATEPQAVSETVEELPLDPEQTAVGLEIRRLESERQQILAKMARYQLRLERVPRVAQQLLSLTRDYDNRQKSYQSLLAKQIDARLAENLERKQQSEQFTVLERAVAPSAPYFPKRNTVLLLALVLSVAIGAGLAILREETDPTFRDEIAIRQAFPGVRCLGSIPRIEAPPSPDERKTA